MPYLNLDLETTGLESAIDRILEIGWLITDDDLNPLQSGRVRNAVVTPSIGAMQQIDASQFIQDMHGKSGLLDDLMEPTTLELSEVEDLILADIAAILPDREAPGALEAPIQQPLMLAGSGVHFDKEFISIWMPRLYKRLHYRIFDVSTLVRFFETLGVQHGVEHNEREHRADADVEYALAVAHSYQTTVKDLIGIARAFKIRSSEDI